MVVKALARALLRRSNWHWAERQRIRSLKEVAHLAGPVLLDLGCGAKPYVAIFAATTTLHFGIDTPAGYHAGKAHADVWGDALALPIRDCAVDTVLCTQVLEHVSEPQRLFDEVARVLKPGGYIFLGAPLMNSVHEPPHDFFRFTPYALALLAERAGLRVVSIRNEGGGWAMIGQNVAWRTAGSVRLPGRIGAAIAIATAHLASMPFFVLEKLDARAAFHEGLNYFLVARRVPVGAHSESCDPVALARAQ